MNQEIYLMSGERIASMCPLVGRPYDFLVITSVGNMWIVTLVDGTDRKHGVDHWEAKHLKSKGELGFGTGDAGL